MKYVYNNNIEKYKKIDFFLTWYLLRVAEVNT